MPNPNPEPHPENLKDPWVEGQSGNPKGRPSAGASLREWINQFCASDMTEAELRTIARGKDEPWVRRAAAERVLRTLETGDLVDLEPWLTGEKTLGQLRENGVNTEIVKKAKIGDKGGREIELHDRSGEDFDRVFDRTEGKPKESVEVSVSTPVSITMNVVGPKRP